MSLSSAAHCYRMALGDEKIVIPLVKLEWAESSDVIDAFRRTQDRWEEIITDSGSAQRG